MTCADPSEGALMPKGGVQRVASWLLPPALLLGLVGSSGRAETPAITVQPFAPRSVAAGATMFTALDPAATGILTENRYADPRMWGDLAHEFEVGGIGVGVAVGDFDGDGRPDLFCVSKTESCRLFRNLGGWKFADVTEQAGVADHGADAQIWKQGAVFADVNNDGRLDLYLCRFGAANRLYINQGNGRFVEQARAYGLDVVDASGVAAFCDYDRDGWLDLYLVTNLLHNTEHPQGQRDYLFHNNRNGTFTNVTERANIRGETSAHSAIWWDYDQDGWPDLYVTNDFSPVDNLYRNNGDGTFTDVIDRVVPHTPFSSMGADLGDVNNDGLIDLFVPDMAATTPEKDLRTMAEVRSRALDPLTSAVVPQYLRSALYLNTGTGRCLEAAFLAGLDATDWTWSVRFEDLDNDGRLDLHVTNGMHREIHNADLMQRMLAAATPAERTRHARASPVLAESNLAFRNLGELAFENVSRQWGLDEKGVSFGAAFGDFDGDGDLDLVYANYQAGVTVLRNDCAEGHRVMVALRGTVSNRFGVGATVRVETESGPQIRTLVVARGYLSGSEPMLHFGVGRDDRIRRLVVTWPTGVEQSFNDLPVDSQLTITEPAAPAKPATSAGRPPLEAAQFAEIGISAGARLTMPEADVDELSLQPLLPIRLNRRGPALALADVNGDSQDDLVVGGTTRAPAAVLLRHGADPGFQRSDQPALAAPAATNDGPVLLFDFDGDGDRDLLVTRGGGVLPEGSPEYQPQLYVNHGDGRFAAAPPDALPALPLNVGALAAADFNRDGRLDVWIGARARPGEYPVAPTSALLMNRGGRFEDVTDAVAPGLRQVGMVTSALWTDVDGDGWPDLLVCREWDSVAYFHNDGGATFTDRSREAGFAQAGKGWWTSLASADFNGDGRLDYVAGNVGLNTPYRADATHPAVLFFGQFADGSPPQLIEARYAGDRLVPWRVKRQLGAKIPSILKRFPRNDAYARASLEEIVGADGLSKALRFEATEFASGVFLSQAGGGYRFSPLPRLAQIAPIQGIVAGDFDGDGFADIFAVQNSYAPIASVGRFDGGLGVFLKGNGEGTFAPAGFAASGLAVTGDAKALAVTDLNADGWPDFVVSRNNDHLLVFENKGVEGRRALRVELTGLPGNRSAIGAQVELTLSDGRHELAEVSAGSGYSSQSTAACFFGCPASVDPVLVTVRWPSGHVSKHPAESTRSLIAISEAPK